jgi:hypothetical protein|tara:strand:- start:104 stop:754 length:651 start_codon:yes stop_codon:yes gene_type:complete
MKLIIKNFLNSIRIGGSPGKTLLFMWIKNDLKNIQSQISVDLAGGSMENKRFFSTDKYICVDINQSKLDKGKKVNPDAIIINSKIQDFMKNDYQKKIDLLVCVQTMGTNMFFEHDETFQTIKQMYYFLEQGGSMIFNVGSFNTNLDQLENQINEFFNGKFDTLNIKTYGAFHNNFVGEMHWFKRLFLAYLMNIFIPLRTLFGFKKKKLYVFCKNKI